MPMSLNISPVIRQSYINAILDCLQSRWHFEPFMDDLLLFMPDKISSKGELEDLLKALLKKGLILYTYIGYIGTYIGYKSY